MKNHIIDYMENNNLKVIEIGDSVLRINRSESKSALKLDDIQKTLHREIADTSVVHNIMNSLSDNDQRKVHYNIKREKKTNGKSAPT